MSESLRQRLETDLKSAMKSGETGRRDTIRFFLSALKNAEIDKRGPLSNEEEISLLHKQAKRLAESIEQFQLGGRTDLAEKELAQLAILKSYLPAELSDEELQAIVVEAVAQVGATSPKEMGKVMPVVIERVAGRADGKRISGAVKAALAGAG